MDDILRQDKASSRSLPYCLAFSHATPGLFEFCWLPKNEVKRMKFAATPHGLAFNKQFYASPEKLIDACKKYIQTKKPAAPPASSSQHGGRPSSSHFGAGGSSYGGYTSSSVGSSSGSSGSRGYGAPAPPPAASGWGSGGQGYSAPPLPPPSSAQPRQSRWGAQLQHPPQPPPQGYGAPHHMQHLSAPPAPPPQRTSGHVHPSRMGMVAHGAPAGGPPPMMPPHGHGHGVPPSGAPYQWRVGDACQAKWRDSGWYDAVIDALPSYQGGGYSVRFYPAMNPGTVSAASLRPRQ
jgi:hypothetical protein